MTLFLIILFCIICGVICGILLRNDKSKDDDYPVRYTKYQLPKNEQKDKKR